MYRSVLILSIVLAGTNVALVQTIAQAKTKIEIGRIAKSITLLIETVGDNSRGSGALLQKRGDIYTVLTAAHVLARGSSFRLVTADGKVHQSLAVRKANNNLDLAVVTFRSKQSYPVAEIGTSNSLESGSEIYVAGFPAATSTIDDGVFNFTRGEVTGNATKPNRSGYSLIYNSVTLPGMSGGPVFNDEGKLVAIHGQGDRTADGQKTGFNLAITIERFGTVARALGASLEAEIAPLPLATNLKAADYLLSGNEKDNNGDYQGALQDYNKVVALDPKYALAYNNRGYLKAQKLNDAAGALADYNMSIALNPQFATVYNNRGYLKEDKLDDLSGALADYNQAIFLDLKDANIYNNRGLLKAQKLNDAAGALADYNQAIIIDPTFASAYNSRALLKAEKLNDPQGSLADYNRAIEIDPKLPEPYNGRGSLKSDELNDPNGAMLDYNKAIELSPKFVIAYVNRGYLKENKLNDANGAMADYSRAISYDPQSAVAYHRRGILKVAQNDIIGALIDYNQAIMIDPKFAVAYSTRGVLKAEKLTDLNGALADYNQSIALDPQYATAYWNRAVLKRDNLSDKNGAIADFRKSAQLFRQQGNTKDLQDSIEELQKLGAKE